MNIIISCKNPNINMNGKLFIQLLDMIDKLDPPNFICFNPSKLYIQCVMVMINHFYTRFDTVIDIIEMKEIDSIILDY